MVQSKGSEELWTGSVDNNDDDDDDDDDDDGDGYAQKREGDFCRIVER